jgi:ribose-phosphate pyrophosphokinase
MAAFVANLLVAAGYNRVVAIDLHAAQIQGFFDIPVDHLYARPVIIDRVRQLGAESPMVVSPDVGGVKLARAYAKDLECDLAIIDKRRISGDTTVIEHIIGDVKGRDVLLVDDMVSTGGSIVDAARIVKQKGANSVFIIATHAVLAGKAVERLNAADVEKILFADTIPLPDSKIARLETVSIAQLLARAIDRIHRSESVSKLFEPES